MAEAVLKNNARIVFGAVSESHGDGLQKRCCPRFQKQCAHCFRGRLRIPRRRPAKTMLPSFRKTVRALFLGASQHLTSTTRQTNYAAKFESNARDVLGGVNFPRSRHGPEQLPPYLTAPDKSMYYNAASEGAVQWRHKLHIK